MLRNRQKSVGCLSAAGIKAAMSPQAERWPSGRRHQIANLAYWVTGTEGSNPSLSATQSVDLPYNLEKSGKLARNAAFFCPERTGERATERDSALLAEILSARNKNGALSAVGIGAAAVRLMS